MLENKKTLRIDTTTEHCQLTHSDLLVRGYLQYQQKFDAKPTIKKIALNTGLCDKTVSASLDRLKEHGLLVGDNLCLPSDKERWFVRNAGGQGYRYWTTYIKSSESKLNIYATSVYSFLRLKIEAGFEPPFGWSVGYLAKVLSLSHDTVIAALDSLQEAGLLTYSSDPLTIELEADLTPEQQAMFSDAGTFDSKKVAKGKVGFRNGTAPTKTFAHSEEIAYNVPKTKEVQPIEVMQFIDRTFELPDHPLEERSKRVYLKLKNLPDWQADWQTKALDIYKEQNQ